MKKIIVFGAILASTFGFSQDKTTTTTTTTVTESKPKKPTKYFGKNEFKINALYFVLGAAELQYERILNDESSAGVRTFVAFTDDEAFEYQRFHLDGYYRFFFGEKPAAGFFIEGLASYNTYQDVTYNYNSQFGSSTTIKDVNGFGLGIQVGSKFITRNGIIFEINGGIGRNILSSYEDVSRIFGRFAISAGYRF